MLPVHFVAKKDGTQRMVQDYQHINQWMIKNGYLLLLIADILDGVEKRKVFTKLDLRWEYNNIRIKEGNKWKVVFTMYIMNAAFHSSSSLILTLLYLHLRSSFVNTFLFSTLSSISAMRGKEYPFFIIYWFMC